MNFDSPNLISDIVLNVLWQVGCLTVGTTIALVATRKFQLASRKLVLSLLLIAWLVVPLWSLISVPLNLSVGNIEVAGLQERGTPQSDGQLYPELLAVEPAMIFDTTASPNPEFQTPFTLIGILHFIGMFWGLGIAVGLCKLLVDQLALSRVLRELKPVNDSHVLALWGNATTEISEKRRPTLRATSEIDTPFSTGWLRPTVVLPQASIESWSNEELFAAMSHELAHWRQRDLVSCRLQRIVQIIHWWNPLVRILNRKLCHVQEVVCDTIAVHAGSSQRTYASLLIKIAENLRGSSRIPNAAVGMARNISSLEQRIRTITSKETTMKSIEMKRRNMILACTTACCLALPILGVQLTHANEHEDRDKEINEFHFKTKSKDQPTAGVGDVVTEIVIKRDGKVKRIRVPLSDDFEHARVREFIQNIDEGDGVDEIHWIDKNSPSDDSMLDEGSIDELDIYLDESEFDERENVQIFFSDVDDRDDFVRARETTSRVIVRRKSTADPFADDDFVLEEGDATLLFDTEEGHVIKLQPHRNEFDDDAKVIKRRKEKHVESFSPEDVEVELRDELKRAQVQVRRSEEQAQAMLKEQLARMQDQQQVQRRVMEESMKKQQEQLQLMMKKMQRQMEGLSKENERIRKQLRNTEDAFDGFESN